MEFAITDCCVLLLEEDAQEKSVLKKLDALKKGAAQTRVMKPQPKLDSTRFVWHTSAFSVML